MNKQKKQFVIMIASLVFLLLIYLGISHYNDLQEENTEGTETDIAVIELLVEDVTAFSYVLEDTTLSFYLENEAWIYEGDTSLDLDESIIETLLGKACAISATEQINDYDSLSAYGLDAPTNRITVTHSAGEVVLLVGNENEITGDYYIMIENGATVYVVDSTSISSFDYTIDELIVEEEETESTEETEEIETTES